MRTARLVADPEMADPTAKRKTDTRIKIRLPKMLAVCPNNGWKAVDVRKYAFATQEKAELEPSSCTIVGRAVEITEMSRAERSVVVARDPRMAYNRY